MAKTEKVSASSDKFAQPRPPMIYFNVGWMKHYHGTAADDPTIGAHGYLAKNKHGAESFNFLPRTDGTVHGYRPPGSRERTNITKLGAASTADSVSGVLVVWLAKEPKSRRTMIVGWYTQATVHREARTGADLNGERHGYSAEARAEDVVLLPPVERTYNVRSSRTDPGEGYGQKPTWYGSDAVDARVWAYIQSYGRSRSAGKKTTPPKNLDPELRRKVEKAAVAHATKYYRSKGGGGRRVVSVEPLARGWDLEASNDSGTLLVEVKGLLNSQLVCELTPNEYAKMMLPENQSSYVVYVVTNALAEAPAAPLASIFENVGGNVWQTADGRQLLITEKKAAVLSCI